MADESIFEKRDFSEEKVNEDNTKITKEKFDKLISDFISINGDIKKIDFTRERNGLPSITYVHKYYGNITNLKQSFGLRINREWNRESIQVRLEEYSVENPTFRQNDSKKCNDLPSLPCILSYFPEYKNFNDIKKALGLELNYEVWTKEQVEISCKKYLENHNKITLKDLKKANGLPTANVIYRIFGAMENFQCESGVVIKNTKKQNSLKRKWTIRFQNI